MIYGDVIFEEDIKMYLLENSERTYIKKLKSYGIIKFSISAVKNPSSILTIC